MIELFMPKMKEMKIDFNLPVTILREGQDFVIYSPVVDLSTVGKSLEESQKHFEEAIILFFEELVKKETLEDVLVGLGWVGSKKAKS